MVYPDSLRFPCGLYGITPEWGHTLPRLLQAVEAAAAGGMVALQWRQKNLPAAQQLPAATQMAALCKRLGVLFLVNDSIDLALAANADGVHLGRDDDALGQARQRLGPEKIIGASCYNQTGLARTALAADVDYVAFGSVHVSRIKPEAVHAPASVLQEGRQLLEDQPGPRPALVAIGGLTLENATPIITAGADSLAVISGLFDADDIQARARAFTQLFSAI